MKIKALFILGVVSFFYGCATKEQIGSQMIPDAQTGPSATVTIVSLEPNLEFNYEIPLPEGGTVLAGMKGRGTAEYIISPPDLQGRFEQSPDLINWVTIIPLEEIVVETTEFYKKGTFVFQVLTNLEGNDENKQFLRFNYEN